MDVKLHELIWDLAAQWSMDTQELEGLNNTIRYITKLAPFIKWADMVARTLGRKSLVGYRGDVELQAAQVATCVAHHKQATAFAAQADAVRYELGAEETWIWEDACLHAPAAPAARTGAGCASKLLTVLRKLYRAKCGTAIKPDFSFGFLMTMRGASALGEDWQMCLVCDSYRKSLWVTRTSVLARSSTSCSTGTRPALALAQALALVLVLLLVLTCELTAGKRRQ